MSRRSGQIDDQTERIRPRSAWNVSETERSPGGVHELNYSSKSVSLVYVRLFERERERLIWSDVGHKTEKVVKGTWQSVINERTSTIRLQVMSRRNRGSEAAVYSLEPVKSKERRNDSGRELDL